MSFLLFLLCLARLPVSAHVSLPAPVNLTVVSINFFPKLQWDPGPGTPMGTLYSISKRSNNKKFTLLSEATSNTSVTLKLNASNDYKFRVWANFNGSKSEWTKVDFYPYTDNVVGPPMLSVAGCGTCLRVNISLPEADKHSGVTDIQKFYGASFKILLKNKQEGKVNELEIQNKNFTLEHLKKGVEYCVQADLFTNAPKKTIPSTWSCAFTSPADAGTGAAKVSSVVAPVISLLILFLIVSWILHFTGFLCKLKVNKPGALMTPQAKYPILTPDETCLDPISISSGLSKQKKLLLRASLTSSEDEEDQDDEEEGVGQLYVDRNAELSSEDENEELKSCRGSGDEQVVANDAFSSLKEEEEEHEDEDETEAVQEEGGISGNKGQRGVQGEEEEERMPDISCSVDLFSVTLASLAGGDEDETEAVQEEGGISGNMGQRGVQGEEEEERMPDISCSVDLFSVTLASLAAGDEDEEEECKDFLNHLNQHDSPTPSEVCMLLHPAHEEEMEDSCAHLSMQSEEEEEEDFSGYLGHR